jgi:hypothetical protein
LLLKSLQKKAQCIILTKPLGSYSELIKLMIKIMKFWWLITDPDLATWKHFAVLWSRIVSMQLRLQLRLILKIELHNLCVLTALAFAKGCCILRPVLSNMAFCCILCFYNKGPLNFFLKQGLVSKQLKAKITVRVHLAY